MIEIWLLTILYTGPSEARHSAYLSEAACQYWVSIAEEVNKDPEFKSSGRTVKATCEQIPLLQ